MRILSLCLIILCSGNASAQEVLPTANPKVSVIPKIQDQSLKNSTEQNLQTSAGKEITEKSQKVDPVNISAEELHHQMEEGSILPHEAFEGEIFDTTQNNQQVDRFRCTDYSNVKHMIIDIDDFQGMRGISETKLKTFFALESLSVINFDTMRTKASECLKRKISILLSTATKLKYLRLCHINLDKFPEEICNLKYLVELNVEDKKIPSIPSGIENLKNLKRFMIKCNKIRDLPKELGNLSALEHLYLKCNRLTKLPPEIGNLTNLKYLNLHCRELEKLPKEITNLTNLKYINCVDSQITSFTVGGNARNLVVEIPRKFSIKSIFKTGFNFIKWKLSVMWDSLKKWMADSRHIKLVTRTETEENVSRRVPV